jgi:phage tail-like protein
MPDRHGPLRTSRFKLELDDVTVEGFQRVEIPSQTTQQVEYREGTDPDHHKKLWGRTQYEDLTMERGVKADDMVLYDWRKKVTEGNLEEARKNIAVILLDEMGESQIRWEFTKAWPKKYTPPTLEADAGGGQGNVATETVVVTYDEMKRTE